MSNLEKIDIYVPEKIGNLIKKDAMLFEIFKKDCRSINRNKFLNMLLKGYYNLYAEESQEKYNAIIEELQKAGLDKAKQAETAEFILNKVVLPSIPPRKDKNPCRISLKPINDTENIINNILEELNGKDYISQYFCRMIMSYCEKSLNEREQIIFRDYYNLFQNVCANKQIITFSTIWDTKTIHQVIPYKIMTGQDEMFNYLLCAEINRENGTQRAIAYRLNRITKINLSNHREPLKDDVLRYLELMIQYGPQYAINDDEETCVKLSDYGEKSYNRIYYGRPMVDHIEHKQDGHYYYFRGSKDQIFLYFRKFGYNDAEVISPDSLRNRIIAFHSNALNTYKKDRSSNG